uniref:Putative ribosomal protein L7 n=1 Tax=Taeniopygia guttata TaxID=59729 RepID=B5G3W1_TAEGU|nr:putative ribosomal protein L7 [Taeniopygia guttata]
MQKPRLTTRSTGTCTGRRSVWPGWPGKLAITTSQLSQNWHL